MKPDREICNNYCLLILILAAVFVTGSIPNALGADIERESLSLLYEPENVITAMRSLEPAIESPAIISIFTAAQIRELGARTIPELLEYSPGFSPWRSIAGDWWPGPRGVLDSNRNFVVLIDGVSINNQFLGTPYWTYDLLDLSRFSRIEIIRGPGSAMYGSNAFLAVINCITETKPPEGGYLKTLIGSFNTRGIGLSNVFRHGRTIFDLNFSGMGSDGQSRYIERDVFGKSGYTQDGFNKKDFMLKISDPRGYTFLAHRVEGSREGYLGYFENLNKKTFFRRSNDLLSFRYNRKMADESSFTVGLFYNRFIDSETAETVSPGGTAFGTVYPLGVIENDHSKDAGWGINMLWKGRKTGKHQLSIRGELSGIELLESDVSASYASPGDPGQLSPLPGAAPKPERFTNNSLTVQDDIRLSLRSRIVLDARYDKHSLFGDRLSTRAALIRRFDQRWTGKFLFGKAYRNPDFHEINRTRNLKPEQIATYEFQLLGELFDGWFSKVNFFVNNLSDRIESPRLFLDYRNISKITIDGMEFEIKKRFRAGQEFFGNISTFRLRSETQPATVAPGLPHNKLNIGYSFKAGSYDTCIWGSFSARQPRNYADARESLSGRSIINMTVQKTGFPGISDKIILRVRNLLNRSLSYVSVDNPVGVLDEHPQSGREISLEMLWNL
ncbi:MAG: hypothetical protein CVV41_22100 [Candidatus Riflebacteria bacterium HGW-Riflebacteria-1]|jgi:iron complex outermembrane receptor protein|nr:MAG: hypothetical protein CVV41_22100 [Candidatus Riflebacteria bacterium HGW-Riflebacteria-1]